MAEWTRNDSVVKVMDIIRSFTYYISVIRGHIQPELFDCFCIKSLLQMNTTELLNAAHSEVPFYVCLLVVCSLNVV